MTESSEKNPSAAPAAGALATVIGSESCWPGVSVSGNGSHVAELITRAVESGSDGKISTSTFNEERIRSDVRETLKAAKGCRLEIAMKDVHTLNNEPDRLARWVRIAREVIEEQFG